MTDIWLNGHSLGGPTAILYGLSRVARGLPLTGIYTFAPASPGEAKIAKALTDAGVALVTVKNGPDYVTDVPFHEAIGDLDYDPALPWPEWLRITQNPMPHDFDLLFRWHHIALYHTGVHLMLTNDAPVTIQDAVDACLDLYAGIPIGFDWVDTIDGQYWGMRKIGDAKLLTRRGSTTGVDWILEDLDFVQEVHHGLKTWRGAGKGVWPALDKLDAALAA